MARYDYWPAYVPVAARRRQAEAALARLRKSGQALAPVVISGRTIARTVWGKAWCKTMEGFGDFANRLPRGRSYVRNGALLDLKIMPARVLAQVSGSSLYSITITIAPLSPERWKVLRRDCAGRIESLVDLLQGKLSPPVMERMCQPGNGIFPLASEIKFSCSCPDSARMCKHVAASLYGIGARLDDAPELLFVLRNIDHTELVSDLSKSLPQADRLAPSARILEADDMAALFGLDLATAPSKAADQAPKNAGKPKKTRTSAPAARTKKRAAQKSSVTAAKTTKSKAKAKAKVKAGRKKSYELTKDGYVKWWKE